MVKRKSRPFNLAKYTFIGAIAGFLSFIVSKLFNKFDMPMYSYKGDFLSFTASTVDINLRQQVMQNGSFAEFGQKMITFLQDKLSFNIYTLVAVILTTIGIFLVGRFLVGYMKSSKSVSKVQVFLSGLAGSAVFSLIAVLVLGMDFGIVPAIITYGGVLGAVMQGLVSWPKLKFLSE